MPRRSDAAAPRGSMRHVDGAPFQLTVRSVQSLSGGTHVSGDLASGAVAVGDVLVVRDGARDVGRVWVDAFSYAWPVRPGESAGLRLTRSEPAPSMLLRITPDAETAVVEGNLLVADPVTRTNRVPRRVVDAGVLGTVSCRDESTPVRSRDGTYRWINIKRFAIAAGIYRLPDLGERAKHVFGWVLGDFFEFVLINRSTATCD